MVCAPGAGAASSLAAGPLGVGARLPGPFFATSPPAVRSAPWALGAGFRRGLGRARPLRRGGPAPPMACPCVPVSAALRASSRGIGRPCLLRPCRPAFAAGPRAPPLRCRGGPVGPLGAPPGPLVPAFAPPAGGARGLRPALWGALRPPPGIRVCRAGFLCAVRCACRWDSAAWRAAVGGPRRPCGRQWFTDSAQCWSTF